MIINLCQSWQLKAKNNVHLNFFGPGVISKTARKTKDTESIFKVGRLFSWICSFKKLLIMNESSRSCILRFVKMPSVKLLKNLAKVGNQEPSALSVKQGSRTMLLKTTIRKALQGKDLGQKMMSKRLLYLYLIFYLLFGIDVFKKINFYARWTVAKFKQTLD